MMTQLEIDIERLLLEGHKSAEIARRLGMKIGPVKATYWRLRWKPVFRKLSPREVENGNFHRSLAPRQAADPMDDPMF